MDRYEFEAFERLVIAVEGIEERLSMVCDKLFNCEYECPEDFCDCDCHVYYKFRRSCCDRKDKDE